MVVLCVRNLRTKNWQPYLLRYCHTIYAVLLLLGLSQCAQPGTLTGGPEDETPPKVVTEKSTPNLQTNFNPESIELTFDEWVKLKDVGQQVIISPPLQGYKVRLKGKTVILDLGDQDTLRQNVTYVIQFGEAVQDLTESNPAEDLRFVFSTGDYIDSLQYRGEVVDAYTSEPVEDALVMLYENLSDTVFRTERPFYFGRTDEDGAFLISNIRAGEYQVCALRDADANYRFSQAREPIAFLPETVQVNGDSMASSTLRLFTERTPIQLLETDTSIGGQAKLVWGSNITSDDITITSDTKLFTAFELDTLWTWQESGLTQSVWLQQDTLAYDTVNILPVAGRYPALVNRKIPGQARQGSPKKAYPMGFSRPLARLDTSLSIIKIDSLISPWTNWLWNIDSTDSRQLHLQSKWLPDVIYTWEAFPGAVVDIYGQSNADTVSVQWSVSDISSLGNIRLRFTAPDSSKNYLVLLHLVDKPPVAQFTLRGNTNYERYFEALRPGDYQLDIIVDENNNGRWDTGRYDQKLQPERVSIQTLESLRPNWDVEVAVELD